MHKIWYSKRGIAWCLLWPLSLIYVAIVLIRKFLYRIKIFKTYRAPCKVVIVGNQTIGGGGKTPMVIELADFLQKHGRKVGVICKGYKGSLTKQPQLIHLAKHTAEQVGDEALLLKQKVACPVVAAQNRVAGAQFLLEQYPECEIIISDDGLTHLALARDLEIIVENKEQGLGNGSLLPAGPLRDKWGSNNKRIYVESIMAMPLNLKNHLSDNFVITRYPGKIYQLHSDAKIDLEILKDSSITAVAAIAHPENFFQTLKQLGLMRFKQKAYPDHHYFQEADFDAAEKYIMTEKDAVKCAKFTSASMFVLPLTAQLSPSLKAYLAEF